MKRASLIKTLSLSVVAIMVIVAATGCEPTTPKIKIGSWYVNYDAHIDYDGMVDDFHVLIDNMDTSQIWHLYFDSAGSPTSLVGSNKTPIGSAVLVTWDFKPVDYCNVLHFGVFHTGVDTAGNPIHPVPLGAWWTHHSSPAKPIVMVPFPLQTWQVVDDTVIVDIVWNPVPPIEKLPREVVEMGLEDAKDTRTDIVINRSWAFSDRVFDLKELMWNNEELNKLEWNQEKSERIPKNGRVELRITGFDVKNHKSVLVKYGVRRSGEEKDLMHFINQVEIEVVKKKK